MSIAGTPPAISKYESTMRLTSALPRRRTDSSIVTRKSAKMMRNHTSFDRSTSGGSAASTA